MVSNLNKKVRKVMLVDEEYSVFECDICGHKQERLNGISTVPITTISGSLTGTIQVCSTSCFKKATKKTQVHKISIDDRNLTLLLKNKDLKFDY